MVALGLGRVRAGRVVRADPGRSGMCPAWSSIVEFSLSKVRDGRESLGMVEFDLGRMMAW